MLDEDWGYTQAVDSWAQRHKSQGVWSLDARMETLRPACAPVWALEETTEATNSTSIAVNRFKLQSLHKAHPTSENT